MGTILHTSQQKTVVLAAHTVVGRASAHVVRLTDPAASNDHASISWNGERWEVRDLGSTNGTWVNGERVPLKERVMLSCGSLLRFGSEAEEWQLTDAQGPVVVARCLATGESRAAEGGLLVLPDEVDVHVSIVMDAEDRWLVEASDGSRRRAMNGETISIADQTWGLLVPPESPFVGTYKAKPLLSMATIALRFHVSHDGDHVRVDVVHSEGEFSLGTKTKFDVLLPLAQARLKDARDPRLPDHDQGWYELHDLTRDVGAQESTVNVMIFRIREALVKAGVEGAEGIVERRPKQLRIGTARILGLDV